MNSIESVSHLGNASVQTVHEIIFTHLDLPTPV